jgi:hypothetical protein
LQTKKKTSNSVTQPLRKVKIIFKKVIRTASVEIKHETKVDGNVENSQTILIEKLKAINERNKEESMEKMLNILVNGANAQTIFSANKQDVITQEQEFYDF